jgi:hypothetical protein
MIPQLIWEFDGATYSRVEALPISHPELPASGLRQTVSSQQQPG